jgi:hypothetical protein
MVSATLTDKASDRLIDNAVDRKAAARADWVTAFLRGESSIAPGQYVYLLEYVDKILITPGFSGVCTITTAKSRPGIGLARAFRRHPRTDMNWSLIGSDNIQGVFGGSPWQPRRIFGAHSPPWSRPSKMARLTRPPFVPW